MSASESDRLLLDRLRGGDQAAWEEVIARYEGRLLAFVNRRLNDSATAEDVVQEAFKGFLVSLPNYDDRTPLENWLFSIAAHKLTDALRRSGRRPTMPLMPPEDQDSPSAEPRGNQRRASSIARSGERKTIEQRVIGDCLAELIAGWKAEGEYERLMCLELLFSLGWTNKDVARRLNISEQTVANHKQFVVRKLKDAATQARLRDFDPVELGLE